MAYVVETDVDRFGYLHGGTNSSLALTTAEHSWTTPFPVITGELELVWEPGNVHRRPNVFHHNLLRDFACDLPTYDFLNKLVRGGLHLVAKARCGDVELVVVQVTKIFDVVDVERSNPYKYAPGGVSFPHIPAEREGSIRGSFFRAPNPGLSLTVLVADDVRKAIEEAGITGWLFERASLPE